MLGRAQETAHVADVVEAAGRGMSSVLVIRGEPGIGKSELLRFAAARARAGGAMVLSARGVERETSIPFAVLQELFRHHEATLAEIPEPRAAALAGALALRGPAPSDRFAVAAGTLSLLGALAGGGSLLLSIDDLQWADAASIDALAFAAHRLGREGIALIVTAVTDEGTGFDGSGFPELVLEGLDRASCLELIAREKPTVASNVAERLITATGGNPLALGELLRTLDDDQLAGRRALDEPIRAGTAIEAGFARRLEQLSPAGRKALTVAAASSSRDLGVIVAAVVDLGLGEAALDEGERAEIVSWRDGILSFRHPLMRAAAYHTAAASDRRAAHRALAAHEQPIAAALHLADASFPPDGELAATLESAAREARGRSGYAAAAELFERAAIFSVDPGDRARRLLESGRAFEVAGDLVRAGSVLDDARASADDPLLRTEIEHVRGRAALWRGELGLARDVLAPEALRVASFSPTSALPILADALAALVLAGEIRAAEALAAEALEQIRGITTELTALSGGVSGQLTVLAGDPSASQAIERLDRLHGDGSAVLEATSAQYAIAFLVQAYAWHEQFDRGRQIAERAIERAHNANAAGRLPWILAALGDLELRAGRWRQARAALDASIELGIATGMASPLATTSLARLDAAQGRAADVRAGAAAALEFSLSFGAPLVGLAGRAALGSHLLASESPEKAVRELEPVVRELAERGFGEPSIVPAAPDLIEAYVLLGRRDAAERELASFAALAERSGRAWALGCVHRCRGFLGVGDGPEEFLRGLELHSGAAMPFERARTQLLYGVWLRHQRRSALAKEPLQEALDTFVLLGAAPWAERAQAEFAAGPGQKKSGPEDRDRLTPREYQVATLVAGGATNKDVATRLFVAVRTVDAHLQSVFRKLGINDRKDLPEALRRYEGDNGQV